MVLVWVVLSQWLYRIVLSTRWKKKCCYPAQIEVLLSICRRHLEQKNKKSTWWAIWKDEQIPSNKNLTVEVNPFKFLDTHIHRDNNEIKCISQRNEITIHWSSAVPKHYKKNVIIGYLHRVKNLISNFEQKVGIIRNKYIKTGYFYCFINSVIHGFNQEKEGPLISKSIIRKASSFIKRNTLWFYILRSYVSLIDQWWITLFCEFKSI